MAKAGLNFKTDGTYTIKAHYGESDEIVTFHFYEELVEETPVVVETYDLSVEDIELGKLLNQINLKCDTSKLTDTISYYDGMDLGLSIM